MRGYMGLSIRSSVDPSTSDLASYRFILRWLSRCAMCMSKKDSGALKEIPLIGHRTSWHLWLDVVGGGGGGSGGGSYYNLIARTRKQSPLDSVRVQFRVRPNVSGFGFVSFKSLARPSLPDSDSRSYPHP